MFLLIYVMVNIKTVLL